MKNAIIAGVVGLLFMVGGFAVGFKMMPKLPPPPAPAAPVATTVLPPGAAVPVPTPDAISMDTLKKTSESMMSLNQALAVREKQVADREAKAKQREDELAAERQALDSSHEKFKALFNDFQSRLQLVEANQVQQLQKQAELYDAMGPDQSIELIRTMDDDSVTRLFSVMDTKPLAKLVAQWKTKYPGDATRLLRTLDNTAQVMPKDKMALNDPMPSGVPATGDSATPAAPTTPAPDAAAPAPDSAAPAPDNSTPAPPALAPPPEPTTPTTPATPAPTTASTDATPDAPAPATATQPDPTTPGATAEAALPDPNAHASVASPGASPVIDPSTVPVVQPVNPSDLGPDGNLPSAPRAKPVNVTTATTN